MALPICPVCGASFDPQQSNCLPFCGERCRLIDLKRWLGEEYGVPTQPDESDQEDEPPAESD
jgi:endogenous inhibitor of DNA gyrase (YacG/DUF329 family)